MELSNDGQTLFLYAYRDRRYPESWYGVLSVDISDPYAIRETGKHDIDILQARLSVDGTLLFVKERGELVRNKYTNIFLNIYRVSPADKSTPLSRMQMKWLSGNFFPTPDGKHLVLGRMGELIVYDISNPSAPSKEFELSPNLGYPKEIGKDGTLYLSNGLNGDELVLASVIPKFKKICVFSKKLSSLNILYISEDSKTVYISALDKTINVIDLADKKAPKIVANYSTPNYVGAMVPACNDKLIYAGLLDSIVVIDPAKAIPTSESLISAHTEALRQYKRKDLKFDFEPVSNAINVLEAAGITRAIERKPSGLSDKVFASILNDYGFFLSKNIFREDDEAIEIYKKVTALDTNRSVAYLNLGESLQKRLSRTDSFQEKIALTKEIKTAYLQYKKLHGKSTPTIDSFLALNIVDTPITDFCEYVTAYTNQERLTELFGTGKSVEKSNNQGSMRVEISYGGSANHPYVSFIDNETNQEIDWKLPENGENMPWAARINIVPFSDGHHLLYYKNGGHLVMSLPIGAAWDTGTVCRFTEHITESFDMKGKNTEVCNLVLSSKHPSFINFEKSHFLNNETLKAARYYSTDEFMAGKVDFDNDGKEDMLVHLQYQSGAGPGCIYDFFDLLNEEKEGFSTSKSRSLLLEMQDIEHRPGVMHPVPHCHGNATGWFRFNGITYFETKYPEDQPQDSEQEFRTVSYIKDGQIKRICEANFSIQVEGH